jgi:hypothetical protein
VVENGQLRGLIRREEILEWISLQVRDPAFEPSWGRR